jgi:hypothetical protein
MREEQKINVGFGNTVALDRVVAILAGGRGETLKRLRNRAEAEGRLLDVTSGRKTRGIIVTDSNHVILSAVQPETLWKRVGPVEEAGCS